MTRARVTITLDPGLLADARAAALEDGRSLSSLVGWALRSALLGRSQAVLPRGPNTAEVQGIPAVVTALCLRATRGGVWCALPRGHEGGHAAVRPGGST